MTFRCSINLLSQANTEAPWYSVTKRLTQLDAYNKPQSITGQSITKRKTQFQEYDSKPKLLFKPSFESKRYSHSLLDQFHTELHRTITNNIKQDQHQIAKRILSIKSNQPRLSLIRYIKTNNKRQTCPDFKSANNNTLAQIGSNNNFPEEEDISLTPTSLSKSTVITMNNLPQTFTAQPFSSHSRLRKYNLPYSDKWRTQIGLNRAEVKYSNAILCDFSFQYAYVRDELNLLYHNYEYYKRNFLFCSDMILSFNNRDLRFQISHNKTLEEVISLLNTIPQLLLMDYYQHIETIIALDSIPKEKLNDFLITNEEKCFIDNANILNSLILFSKSCFDVYLILGTQVNNITLAVDKFNLLRSILKKTRFNITKIISESKACMKNLLFERKLIENYQKTIEPNEGKVTYKRHKLDEIIHNRFQFGKNEQNQKKKRMNIALYQGSHDEERKKIRERIKNRQNAPMAIINSQLMTNLMKYVKKDVREKIISLRIVERYTANED